jgi:hypothetical protein
MKSGILYTLCHGFLVVVVLMTLLAGNVQTVLAAAPSNDDFDDATLIDTTPYSDTVIDVVTTATPQSSDPANDDPSLGICNNELAGLATVWYQFVAPANGILEVDTTGSGYDTVAAVWSGSRGNLSLLSCNDNYYSPILQAFTNAYLLSGNTYFIEVATNGGISEAGAVSAASNEVGALAANDLALSVNFYEVPVVSVGTYDDTDPNWLYSDSGWTHTVATGAYANTHSYNSTALESTEFNFTGDQFTLYYTAASNGGEMIVYVDNNPATTINEFSSTTKYQETWISEVLSPGTHRVRLERQTGTIYVDAIKITYRVAPVGAIGANYNPTYQWNQVPGATWYYLYINGPSGKILSQWYQASSICNASLCAIKTGAMLGGGNYTWWVQTYNSAGYGPWSSAKNFTTTLPTIPDKPAQTSPTGNIGTNNNPTYIFEDVDGATWYVLYLNGPGGNLINKWYTDAQAGCNGSTCSITPSTTLGGGNFTWWVRPWNSAGYGNWSDGLSFNTTTPTMPGKATQTFPTGDIGNNYFPTYTWSDIPGATWYLLYVNGQSGNITNQWYSTAQTNCNGTTCSVTPGTPLGGGTYTWWVQTYNSAGYGPWSDGVSFTTLAPAVPDKPTQTSPTGSIGSNYNPTYVFSDVTDATWYVLYLNGPGGNLINKWYTDAQAGCNGSTCSITPSTTLGGGNFTWWVRPWNSAGYGNWSDGLSFNTTTPTIPGGVP